MRTLAEETDFASGPMPRIATSASRATLRCLILAQSASEGRQRGSAVGNRSNSSVLPNRSSTTHFSTPPVLSFQTKVGATISGGKSVSSRGYLISMPPEGPLGNASGAGAGSLPQALMANTATSRRRTLAGKGVPRALAQVRPQGIGSVTRAIVGGPAAQRQCRLPGPAVSPATSPRVSRPATVSKLTGQGRAGRKLAVGESLTRYGTGLESSI